MFSVNERVASSRSGFAFNRARPVSIGCSWRTPPMRAVTLGSGVRSRT